MAGDRAHAKMLEWRRTANQAADMYPSPARLRHLPSALTRRAPALLLSLALAGCGESFSPKDADGDGKTVLEGDCWDHPDGGAAIGPDAAEIWYDGVDQDCDGLSDDSVGDDAYPFTTRSDPEDEGALDGAELDPADVNPGAAEVWYDGTDANCDGANDYDQDGDTFERDDECDDLDASVFPDPSIPEVWYNDIDEDCDGNLYDQDHDGHDSTDWGGDDCWDDPNVLPIEFTVIDGTRQPGSDEVYPGAAEVYYDGIDGDCAGGSDFDADRDGYDSDSAPDASGAVGDDCDDAEATTYPGATDAWYDDLDADCAGNSDFDADADGYDSSGELSSGTDCDDTRAAVNPTAVELVASWASNAPSQSS